MTEKKPTAKDRENLNFKGSRTGWKRQALLMMIETGDPFILEDVNILKDVIEAAFKIQPYGETQRELILINSSQDRFIDEYFRQMKEGPVRVVIVKGRRCGMSTITQILMIIECFVRAGLRAAIVAPKKEAIAETIFKQLCKPMLDALDVSMQSKAYSKGVGDGFELKKNAATLRIDYEDKIVGVAMDFIHITEAAYFKDLGEFLSHARPTIAPEARNAIIMESTAAAFGDGFHEQWLDAERGKSSFAPMFFSWFDHELNTKAFLSEEEKKAFREDIKPGVTKEWGDEMGLLIQGVGLEQLHWRRDRIVDDKLPKFHREYPSTPEEAFLQTDMNVFDVYSLKWYLDNHVKEPEIIGNFEILRPFHHEVAPILTPTYPGYAHIWEAPFPDNEYCIGVDVAEGRQDFSVAAILKRRPLTLVATLRGYDFNNLDPLRFADQLYHLGKYYHNAPMAIENNASGVSVITHLQYLGYYHIMGMAELFPNIGSRSTDMVGWNNNEQTRRSAINKLQYNLTYKSILIHDEATLSEAVNFVYVGMHDGGRQRAQAPRKGKFRAPGSPESGYYDDRLFALMSALVAHESLGDAMTARDIRTDTGMYDHEALIALDNDGEMPDRGYDPSYLDYDPADIPMAHMVD